jgi:transposase
VAQARLAADQKKARRLGAQIVFVDETGFGFLSRLAPTWAPVGHTPLLRRTSRRRELSVFICLTLSGKLYKRHFTHAIGGEDVVLGLRHLRRQVRGPLILIWDRLNAHRAKSVTHYLASEPEIRVEWLPAYAPDLNPEEHVHGNIKQHLRNATPETVGAIRRQVDRGFARLRQRPDILLRFIRHAGLWVKELW